MWKFGVLGLLIIGLSDGVFAALPGNAWYFSSTYRDTRPDSDRKFDHESGAQYQFGRTLGRLYALELGFQNQDFSHRQDSEYTAQSIYNLSLRRFIGVNNFQWFFLGEAGQIVSKLQGNKITSSNVGLGLGAQQTLWKEGPSLSADLRYRLDYDKESNPEISQYADWVFAFSVTIPIFHKNNVLRAARAAEEKEGGRPRNQMLAKIEPEKPTPKIAQTQAQAKQPTTSGTTNKPSTLSREEKYKKQVADNIDKLRAELTAMEDEEEIKTADFSVGSAAMLTNREMRIKNKISQKVIADVFANKLSDTDLDGIPDYKDKCSETPLGAPVNILGCALDTDKDNVIDLVDLCTATPLGISVDERGCGFDDDVDGVPNHLDSCADTPEDIQVGPNGCELDSDDDGIVDSKDECEGTFPGVKVEKMGCHLTDIIVLKKKHYQTESTILNALSKQMLTHISEVQKRHPELRVELTGNANDPRISELSRRISIGRANSAKLFLLELGTDAEVMDYGKFNSNAPIPKIAFTSEPPEHSQVSLRLVKVK